MGYKGQLGLYVYYIFSALILRALTPPLALMTAQESGLSASFRTAHQVCFDTVTRATHLSMSVLADSLVGPCILDSSQAGNVFCELSSSIGKRPSLPCMMMLGAYAMACCLGLVECSAARETGFELFLSVPSLTGSS